MITAATRLVPTSLGKLRVRIEGSGPPALLWHGMFIDGTSWNRVTADLSARRTLYIVDGPGHGRSETLRSVTTVLQCALTAVELIRHLGIEEPVDWVGNAWGGHVGMTLAIHAPARVHSLVAISSPPAPISSDLRRRIELLRPLLRMIGYRGPLLEAVLSSQLTEESTGDAFIRDLAVEAMRRPDRAGVARAIKSFILERADLSGELHNITAPTLFVASSDRGEFTPRDAQLASRSVRAGSWAVADGARALIPLEQPQWLIKQIEEFWDGPGRR